MEMTREWLGNTSGIQVEFGIWQTTLNPPSSPTEFTPSIPTNITSHASYMLSTSPSPLLWVLSLVFPTLRLWSPSRSSIRPYLKTMSKATTSTLSPPFKHLSSRSSCLGNMSHASTISNMSAESTHPSRSHSTAMCVGAWPMECSPILTLYERYVQLMKRFQVFTYICFQIAYQPLHQVCRQTLWSDHFAQRTQSTRQTHSMDFTYHQGTGLGVCQQHTNDHIGREQHATFILTWKSSCTLAHNSSIRRTPQHMGGEAFHGQVHVVLKCIRSRH